MVTWLAPASPMAEAIVDAANCVVTQGSRANEALRGFYDAYVLLSPPAIDALEAEVSARLRAIEAPVLVLFGTDDPASPPSFGHAWRRALPKCFLMFVYGAGANMAHDRPEAVKLLISDFLLRRDNFLVRNQDDQLHL